MVREEAATGKGAGAIAPRRSMLEKQMILTRGFENIRESGQISGFQLKIRIPYYRGVWLAIIADLTVTVDGTVFDHGRIRVRYKDKSYTMDALARAETVHWDYGDPLDLLVAKSGGLAPGLHDVEVRLELKPAFTDVVGTARRKITLVS